MNSTDPQVKPEIAAESEDTETNFNDANVETEASATEPMTQSPQTEEPVNQPTQRVEPVAPEVSSGNSEVKKSPDSCRHITTLFLSSSYRRHR